jgi:hypothetical protein
MALQLTNFFTQRGYIDDILNYQMSTNDLPTARAALKNDIDCFLVNGLISLSSAIGSLKRYGYSWSFIQSYYSVFYLARAFNGINDYSVVYKASKPYGIKIQPGEKFVKLKGNSHEVVLSQFKTYFSSDVLLSSQIENISPIDWFNQKRSFINYSLNPQTDPMPPLNLFQYKTEFRKWVATYFNDTTHIYTFDPGHCYFAYPLQLFARIFQYYSENNLKVECLDENKIDFFRANFSDNNGSITIILAKILELVD